jgi:uncharacterized protein YueI
MEENKKKRKPGRPPGSKDSIPRKTSARKKDEAKSQELSANVKSDPSFISNLTKDTKSIYRKLARDHDSNLEALKELAKTMEFEYKLAASSALNSWETRIKNAKEALEELERTKKVSGKTASEEAQAVRRRNLIQAINEPYKINSAITTKQTELAKIYSEIERIESGTPSGDVNIWQIINGQADPKQTKSFKDLIKGPIMPSIADEHDIIDVKGEESDGSK